MMKPFLGRLIMLVIVAVLVLIVLNQIGVFKPQMSSYPAENKLLKNEFVTDAIIFRNEALVMADQGGDVTFMVEDGERVPQGSLIATITPSESSQAYQPFSLSDDWLIDMELIEQEYTAAQDQLAYLVKESRLSEVDPVKVQLDQLLTIRNAYQQSSGLVPQETALATEVGSDGKIHVTAPHGGIVGYTVAEDDLLYNPFNIPLIDYNQYKVKQEGQILRRVLANQPFIRLVSNRETYLVIRVDETTLKQFTLGRRIDVDINGQTIRPVVTNIFKHGKEYGIQLTVLEEYNNDYNDRTSRITVIPQQLEGLAIKTSSLVEQDKVMGVYVLKKGYRSEFVPVKVLGFFGNEAIIASDNFLVSEGSESVVVPTVNLYDEILEEPNQ